MMREALAIGDAVQLSAMHVVQCAALPCMLCKMHSALCHAMWYDACLMVGIMRHCDSIEGGGAGSQ
jgi:hypothetical protein